MKKNFTFILGLLLTCMVYEPIFSQPKPQGGAGKPFVFSPPETVGCNNSITFSQVNPADNGSPSQIFSDFPAFSTESADDFTAPISCTISSIDISGAATGFLNLGISFILNVYDDNAGVPGTLVFTETFAPASVIDPDGDGIFSLFPTNTTVLAPGTYWFSVVLDCAFGTCGQFFWLTSTDDLTGNPWVVRNPGDGFGTGCTDWCPAPNPFAGGAGPGLQFGMVLCPLPTPTISQTDLNGDGTPDIMDPCSCADPQNSVNPDGTVNRFHDFVTVTSGPGETWQVTASAGAFVAGTGPATIANGTVLTETVIDAFTSVYTLDPIFHNPGVGFTMTVDRTAGGGPFPLNTGGTCTACQQIPTLGQWGLIVLSLLLLTFGVVALRSRQTVLAGAGSTVSMPMGIRQLPFDRALFGRMLAGVMTGLAVAFTVAIAFFGYEMTAADVPGSLVAGPLLAYLLHLAAKKD